MKFLFCCSSSFSSVSQIETAIDGGQNHQNFHVFSSNELKTATHGFSSSNKIGEGGFGSVYKAWEVYNAGNLVKLVDPTLQMNYPEEEAFRFFKVGLLCVQENVRLRPTMSEALKMLCNEMDIQDVQISRPGLVADLMDIKLSQKIMSHSISSSGTGSIPNSTSF
ncbi:hypothetical protein Patl1_32082 [Pistacia atlantica]|uniref:Uncharacterized protein n=1 Tax=Pistacia atlantica TaxID=434234 RepID=A0ACC1ARV3_9ROSI|nr:hypothetical protein Patl1_32082 [Pistacia atlantica]